MLNFFYSNKKIILLFLLSFTIALLFAVVTRWIFLGDFLDQDDTIHLPRAIFDVPVRSGFGRHGLVNAFSVFGSISGLKLVPLVAFSLCSALITLILRVYAKSLNPGLAVLTGISISTIPLATDQIVFVTASHPTFSLCLMLLAVLTFGLAIQSIKRLFLWYVTLTGLMLSGAAWFSPVGTLAPVALPIWIVLAWIVSRKHINGMPIPWYVLGFTISIIFASSYYIAIYEPYHYVGVGGMTEFTVSRIIANLNITIVRIADIYGPWNSLEMLTLSVILLAMVVAVIWGTLKSDQSIASERTIGASSKNYLLILGFCTLILSALSFGPGSIVTIFKDRYLVAPFCLGLLSVFALVFYLTPGLSRWRPYVTFSSALLALFVLNGVKAHSRVYEDHKDIFATHIAVKRLVEKEGSKWPARAQVVILLSQEGYSSPTRGYNHWSTWYLRFLTGNTEIIGLLGQEKWVKSDPFVEQYHDYTHEYWDDTGPRSRRIRMKGLEKDRPTYVYRQNETGRFEAISPVIFGSTRNFHTVTVGDTFETSERMGLIEFCRETESSSVFVWPGPFPAKTRDVTGIERPDANVTHNGPNSWALSQNFDGRTVAAKTFDIPEGTPFRLDIKLRSTVQHDLRKYDEYNPPMPLLSPAVAFYQRNWGVSIADRDSKVRWEVTPSESGYVGITIQGVQGCVILLGSNGQLLGNIKGASIDGTWQFGRGFLKRFWRGQIDVNFESMDLPQQVRVSGPSFADHLIENTIVRSAEVTDDL